MINQILCVVFMTMPGIVEGFALDQMLEPDREKTKKLTRVIIWAVYNMLWAAYLVFTDPSVIIPGYMKTILIIIGFVFIEQYLYKDPIWRKIFAAVAIFFAVASGELTLFFSRELFDPEILRLLDHTTKELMIVTAIANVFAIAAILVLMNIWSRGNKKGKKMKYSVFFILYACNQSYVLTVMGEKMFFTHMGDVLLFCWMASVIIMMILIVILFNQAEKETMEQELQEMKQKKELEQKHYLDIARKREEIEKIFQYHKNEVYELQGFLKDRQMDKAEKSLKKLYKNLEKTREYPYCGIPIVNVVLSEKEKICEEKNVRLEVSLRMPEEINIKQMDLCRIFGNLLDNAIRACESGQVIYLTSGVLGEYLMINCENPTLKVPGEIPEGSGYGKVILKDIAKQYQGEFDTVYENGIFCAQVMLRLS